MRRKYMKFSLLQADILNSDASDGDRASDADSYYKAGISSFADMLLVKESIIVLYSNVIKSQVQGKIAIKP